MLSTRLCLVLAGCAAVSLTFLQCVGDSPTVGASGAADGGGDGGSDAGPSTTTDGSGPGPMADAGDAGVVLPLLQDAVSVAAGRAHTCAITAAQDVLCWGSNSAGQLGVPTAQYPRSSQPLKVDLGGSKASAIAAGANHTCAVAVDGKIMCWGDNQRGQLGRGTLVATGTVAVVSPPSANVALWTTAEVITAGAAFTCAGMKDTAGGSGLPFRRFFCWGENVDRQSGTESTNGQPTALPSLITLSGNDSSPALEGFGISAGDNFACAGLYAGAGAAFFSVVGCWGSRSVGQIGAPPAAGYYVGPDKYPSRLADGGTKPLFGLFKDGLLATGAAHGCARIEQSGVTPPVLDCWGNNTHGQVGAAQLGFLPVTDVAGYDATDVTALAAGGKTTCVIDNGQAKCVGANDVGQLGQGTLDATPHPTFANVAQLPNSASALSVGANHACAVLGAAAGQKGKLACWGQNDNGQLGDGLDLDKGYPGAPMGEAHVRKAPVMVLAPK